MLVKDIMVTDFVTLVPDLSWREAARLLLERKTSSAPVVENNRLVGILSEKDLFRGLFPSHAEWAGMPHGFLDFEEMETVRMDGRTVGDVMSRRIISARPDTPVLKVGAQMVASGIHHVPVVEDGAPVGLVSRGTIYRAILGHSFEVA